MGAKTAPLGAAKSLSRDSIVDRAVAIADLEGLDAVSIRRLGQEFGVTPMALYWHVKNKDELLDAMGDELFAGVSTELEAGTSWLEQLRSLVQRYPQTPEAQEGRSRLNAMGVKIYASR